MENILEKRYEKRGALPPSRLNQDDILQLAALIQETFSKTEIERFFRISTNIDDTRVFSNSLENFLSQPELPQKFSDLSFMMQGWQGKTRFDKAVLLDFSKYSVQLSVGGLDPVWVYDQCRKIDNFLKNKTAGYWPLISLERFLILGITTILVCNIIISRQLFLDKLLLLGLWVFLVFFDTRKVWPYSCISLKNRWSVLEKENIALFLVFGVIMGAIIGGAIMPLLTR
ncbi:MAG: hypothetical protein FJ126_05450 [Deltaproteobacteria bacterium]|nr:hypothetical protein [Deltaproteobacteria bacterium]